MAIINKKYMGLARIERAAYRLGGDRSIQLSYSPNFVLL
jgi:hypothetical protein